MPGGELVAELGKDIVHVVIVAAGGPLEGGQLGTELTPAPLAFLERRDQRGQRSTRGDGRREACDFPIEAR